MGLIKQALNSVLETGKGAVKGTLEDQYKEAIRCPNMSNDLLMKAVTSPTGVISNGSIVVVDPGQCAVVVDNGRVIDATAEEGTFVFDNSSTPSFFAAAIGTTGIPRSSSISLILTEPPLPRISSIILSASTIGTFNSISCIVR